MRQVRHIPIHEIGIAGVISAAVVLVVAAALRMIVPSFAQTGEQFQLAQLPNVSGNCNNFGNNNFNCNTIITPSARHLTEQTKTDLLSHIPKSRQVNVKYAGESPDAGDFANEIIEFLRSQGYKISGPDEGFGWKPAIPHGTIVTIDPNGGPTQIVVGLNS